MISANLSLGEKIKNHRLYINRTLWTSYVALPFLAAYFILGTIMMVSRSINYAEIYHQTEAVLFQEKLRAVSRVFGMEGLTWVFVVGIAVMFALQGFSYIFNQSQLDFYLSQPTTRSQRVRRNYDNAFSTFLVLYLGTELLALLVATAMGAVNRYLLLSVLIQTVKSIILFLAFYNVTVLAVILSGTMPIAILLTGCFTFISIVISGETALFKEMFFATYSGMEPMKVYLSPLYDIFAPMSALYQNLQTPDALLSMRYINTAFDVVLFHVLDTLVVGIIAMIAVMIFAKNRQSEWAGKSIPLKSFRFVVKTIVCIVVGLGSGYFVYIVYNSVWNSNLYFMMAFIMALSTIVTGCITEVILEGNIKRFFKGMSQTILALAVVLLVFIIFRGDLIGYDSFVPAADRVESGAIISDYRNFSAYDTMIYDYMDSNDANYMYLSDTEALVKIASEGMKTQKEFAKANREGRYENMGYQVSVLYRMKSGKKIYRQITIPFDAVDAELDRIVSSEEYKRGHFDVFHDDYIREADKTAVNHSLRFVVDSSNESKDTKKFSFAELSDAYRKDLLENYSFSYMKEHMPVGSVEYESNDMSYIYGTLDIYDNFTNTIALLKKYGIYSEYKLTPETIKYIRVINLYPGYDLEVTDSSEIEDNPDSVTVTYSDDDNIEAILAAGITTSYYNPWYNYNNVNDQYSVEIVRENDSMNYGGTYYSFKVGKVPDFVKADTNK